MDKFLSKTTLTLSVVIDEYKNATVKFAELKKGGSVFYTDDATLSAAMQNHVTVSGKYTYEGEVDDVIADEIELGGIIRDQKVIYSNSYSQDMATQAELDAEQARAESAEGGLDERLGIVEQLADISISGGDATIATASDFNNPTTAQKAYIPTVGAILDGADNTPTSGSGKLVTSGGVYNVINSLKSAGYVFVGVATPSTSPGTPTEKVFYIGGAGTYANFGTSVTVPVGSIGVFKYNGSWTKETITMFAGIDDVPTAGSDNLVKSGGVYNEINQLEQEIINVSFTEITGKYITPSGRIGDSAVGFYSTPIFVPEGSTLTYSIKGFGCAILSTYNNGVYTPIVVAPSTMTQYTDETFTAPADCYVAFSGTPGTLSLTSDFSRIDSLEEQLDGIKQQVASNTAELTDVSFTEIAGKYIRPDGQIGDSAVGFYSTPIFVPEGSTLTYSIKGFGCAILSLYNNGSYTPIVVAPSSITQYTNETFTAVDDCYVAFSGTPGTLSLTPDFSRIDLLEEQLDGIKQQVASNTAELTDVSFTEIAGKYIRPDGQIGDSAVGFYSTPIFVPEGSTLTYSIEGFGCAILSTYNNGVYTPIVVAPDGSPTPYINETFTAVDDCYVAFSGTPGTLSLTSDFSRIDSLETEIRLIGSVENNGSYYETIKAGIVTNDGEIKLGSLYSVLFLIQGGRGFYLELNSGYVINSSHLFDENSQKRLQSNFVGSGSWVPLSFGNRAIYGQDTTIRGQFVAIVIKKEDNSLFNEDELGTIIKKYCKLDDIHLHRWVIEQPWFKYAHKRMRAISNIQWLCKNKVRAITGEYNSVRFLKNETYNGVPYSDVSEKNKYVGVYVTPYTFLTAAENKRSLVYTEDLVAKTSGYGIVYDSIVSVAGCYYGSVCSGFTAAIMGLQLVYLVSGYANGGNVPNLSTITNVNDIQPLDLIYYSGHISIISDIYKDDYGEIKYILWAEYNYPNVFIDVYTFDTFKERLEANNALIRRYSAWNDTCTDIEIPEDIPADTFDYTRPLPTSKDIYVFSGDKSCFSLDDIIYLNLNRENGYTHLLVYKNNAETPFINVDISQMESDNMYEGEDWVKYNLRQHELGLGKYRAVLYDGENYSNNCYFEIIDTSFTLNISDSTIYSVSFTSQNSLPFAIMSSSRNYYTYRVKEFTEQEQDGKTATLNWPVDSEHPYITVLFRGEYGVAQKRVNTI